MFVRLSVVPKLSDQKTVQVSGSIKKGNPGRHALEDGALMSEGERGVIGVFTDLAQSMGIPKSLAEIYGVLFANPHPLSFKRIQEKLGLSKGSVSQGLRFLRENGMIRPIVNGKKRNELFEPVVEIRQLVSGFINERIQPQLSKWQSNTRTLTVDSFSGGGFSLEEKQCLSDRLDKLTTWQKKTSVMLPLIGRMLG